MSSIVLCSRESLLPASTFQQNLTFVPVKTKLICQVSHRSVSSATCTIPGLSVLLLLFSVS